jgi:hypothetical protein
MIFPSQDMKYIRTTLCLQKIEENMWKRKTMQKLSPGADRSYHSKEEEEAVKAKPGIGRGTKLIPKQASMLPAFL